MGAFLQALSALAPVAPAMSDARDLRTQREQEEAQFGQETELKKAQLTAQNLAAQVEQQKLTQGNAPAQIPGTKDYYDPAQGSWMRPSLVNGEFKAVKIPGQAPADELKNATAGLTDAFKVMGMSIPPSVIADLGYRIYGGTGANPSSGGHYLPIPGAAGQPRLGADGKTYVRDMFDPSTNQNVEQPMPAGYVPPEPKPGTPRPGLSQGKNVFGFFNPGKKQWQDAAGNALPDFKPQPSFAETGLFEPMASYDPQTQSIAMGSFNRRTGRLTFANGSGASVPLPPAIAATIGKEFSDARSAQTRLRIMQQNAQQAYQGNEQAMVSLLMNHIGMTLGAQKGTRIAKTVIDDAEASAPWIETKLASIGHRDENGDFIFDGLKGGTNLTGEQVKQMVDLANQRNTLQWQQVKDTGATYGVDLSGAISQTQGGAPAPAAGGGNASTTYKQTATGPGGHKIGSNDGGVTWFDVKTGKKI